MDYPEFIDNFFVQTLLSENLSKIKECINAFSGFEYEAFKYPCEDVLPLRAMNIHIKSKEKFCIIRICMAKMIISLDDSSGDPLVCRVDFYSPSGDLNCTNTVNETDTYEDILDGCCGVIKKFLSEHLEGKLKGRGDEIAGFSRKKH